MPGLLLALIVLVPLVVCSPLSRTSKSFVSEPVVRAAASCTPTLRKSVLNSTEHGNPGANYFTQSAYGRRRATPSVLAYNKASNWSGLTRSCAFNSGETSPTMAVVVGHTVANGFANSSTTAVVPSVSTSPKTKTKTQSNDLTANSSLTDLPTTYSTTTIPAAVTACFSTTLTAPVMTQTGSTSSSPNTTSGTSPSTTGAVCSVVVAVCGLMAALIKCSTARRQKQGPQTTVNTGDINISNHNHHYNNCTNDSNNAQNSIPLVDRNDRRCVPTSST